MKPYDYVIPQLRMFHTFYKLLQVMFQFTQDHDVSSAIPCFLFMLCMLCTVLYPFTERHAQPYFFHVLIRQVLEGQSKLLVNAPTPTFLNVNHYLSKAPKELPVFPNGLKEWSLSFTSTIGHEVAYGMSWKTLMKMMTDKYCPQNKIRKLEIELWELKVKGTDLASYTQRFQELALLCGRMFFEEADKIEKYVGGLLDMIHGSVVASKPKTMQEAIEIATELMDKKIRTFAERETASKRKFENTSRNT
nr:reverse transcriptase domain-containing protein [Tanacetum cinerariifolium]